MSNLNEDYLKIDHLGQKYSKGYRKSHNSDLFILKCCFCNSKNPELPSISRRPMSYFALRNQRKLDYVLTTK